MTNIFASVNQNILFTDDKPSPAFINAWHTNTEFSSIAALQSICKLSRLNVMHCNIPAYPTAHLAFPTSIWIPFLGLLASTLLPCCAALLWPSDLSVRAGDAMREWEDSLFWRRNSSYSSRSGLFRRKFDCFFIGSTLANNVSVLTSQKRLY